MISTVEDEFVSELQDASALAIWQCELSDGSVVSMDDGRPGIEPRSAWLRLAAYLKSSGLKIVGMWLKFRTNCDKNILPRNADGYFFSKNVIDALGRSDDEGGRQASPFFYIVGALVNGKIEVQRYSIPSLTLIDTEIRDPETARESLIRN
jgi:hypothetical protein